MAHCVGLPTTVHISGGFGFVYMLHFASVVADIGRYQEYRRAIVRYRDWLGRPLGTADGALSVPVGPGAGITNSRQVLKGAEPVL